MSREVRRVPLGWRHPTEPDPKQFVPLFDDYIGSRQRWEGEGAQLRTRTGQEWEFLALYHLAQHHPFHDERDQPIAVRDEDHLQELVLAEHATEEPDPARYMPVFDAPEDELGWCLYETVSEGTPVTPVFAHAEELVEHLSTVGTEWSGPLRREAAEALVSAGWMPSLVAVAGAVYRGDVDADRIAELSAEQETRR